MKGDAAETLAAEFLERRGLRLVARNYRCRGGELDLIAREGKTLVFVEVRLRADARFGGAVESVTAGKRKRLRVAANHFLLTQRADAPCRFDVIALDRLDADAIVWIKDAFGASEPAN